MQVSAAGRAPEYLALLTKRLPEETVRHSVSVARMLEDMAQPLGLDPGKAATAGLLHDVYKDAPAQELLERAHRYGLTVSEAARARPGLLHGPVGAEECRRNLGLVDPDLYEAIYWHTTGHPGIGSLALALIVADFSEPLREYPEAEQARALFLEQGLRAAARYVAEQKLRHARMKHPVDPATEAFCGWLAGDAN